MPSRNAHRSPDGSILVELPEDEIAMLRSLADEMAELVEEGLPDEARSRLYPPAYDNPLKQAEFRRLMAGDLEERKAADLATMRATLARPGSLLIGPDEVGAWLGALQDMRLTLGTLLGIEEDGWEQEVDEDDPQMGVFHYLGYIQDALVQLVM